MSKSYRVTVAFLSLLLAGCGNSSGPPSSLTGTWTASNAGLMYNLTVRFSDDWSGYRTNCSPVNGPACLASGRIGSASISGSEATIDLIPTSPCGNYNARITGTASGNRITGNIVYSSCNNPNYATAPITLTR